MGQTRVVIREDGQELKQRHPDGPLGEKSVEDGSSGSLTEDVIELARFGKKQVLRRNFGLASMTGFSCGLMSTWEGMLTGFILGLTNGGPAGLVYGLIVTWIGTLSVFMVMGELSSMVPTAGGQYHWVSILAPPYCKKFLSYITGWLTVTGWIAGLATTSFFVSSLLLALVNQIQPNYVIEAWHVTLLFWGILGISVLTNTLLSSALPFIEILVLIIHVVGFFATLIPLVYLSDHNSAADVFENFQNGGGWSSMTLSFFIGLQGNANAFIGTDGAVHMSEEVKHASRNVPKAMVISVIVNGILALAILLAVLFCKVDLEEALQSQYPFVLIFATALNSNAGAAVLTSLVIILMQSASIGALAAASRMIWAFARDKGVPGWRSLSKINRWTAVPLLGVAVVTTIAALLGAINFGSSTVFNDIISLTLEGLFTSYLIAAALLLYRRVRGEVGERSSEQLWDTASSEEDDESNEPQFTWGPWRVPGIWGILNNIVACIYLIVICFFSFWPTETPVTPVNMTYSQTVWGAVVIFSVAYYVIHARHTYKGPIVEVELLKAQD